MKVKLNILIIIVLSISSIFGQDADSLSNKKQALMFKFDRNFSLSSFDGTVLSYKKMVSEHIEHRYSLSLTGSYQKPETTGQVLSYDTTLSAENIVKDFVDKDERFSMNIEGGIFRIRHQKNDTDIHLYYGAGPYLITTYSKNYSQSDIHSLRKITVEEKRFEVGIGIKTIFGVEWKVKDNISFNAEYQPYGYWIRRHSDSIKKTIFMEEVNYTESESRNTMAHSINFRSTVLFGVSIYF